ncbi:hypothetical protein OF83DRAFT_916189 [Amylostereum chailletii]|nr:hypothetical protein OF83DRAFT_916189 [Amylostereum chailletii]
MSIAPSTSSSGSRCFGLNIQWVEDDAYSFINDLRTVHYPREHQKNPAHISLFAHLDVPQDQIAAMEATLFEVASKSVPFSFKIQSKAHQWGKTVVLRVSSDKLYKMRKAINRTLHPLAIVNEKERRDKSFQAHITVHARVSKSAALQAHGHISETLSRYAGSNGALRGKAVGIVLVEYIDEGPWREVATYGLSGSR